MNNFTKALQDAINCKGIEQKVTITNIDGSNKREGIMIEGKQGTSNNCI